MSEINSPGPNNNAVGKPTSGSQDQGSNIDVTNFAKVNTGQGPSTVISSEFTCDLVKKIPTGEKTGGL